MDRNDRLGRPLHWCAVSLLFFVSLLFAGSGMGIEVDADGLRLLMEKNSMNEATARVFMPYIHQPVRAPFPEGISLMVDADLGNRQLAELGILDVTAAPFFADPTGIEDSTGAIQSAVDRARDRQMIVYFPAGDYILSDTISCFQKLTVRSNWRMVGAERFPCVLRGTTRAGKRSRLILRDNSPGFGDPERRKIVVHYQSATYGYDKNDYSKGPLGMQAGISFNNLLANVDIVIGRGNKGAIGVRLHGAEGSGIYDVNIDARHGHTGIQSAAGGGGSYHNVAIVGGRYGIDTRGYPPQTGESGPGTQPTPVMSAMKLHGQTQAGIYIECRGPFVGVGFEFEMPVGVPAIVDREGAAYNDGQICFVDTVISYPSVSGENVALRIANPLYFKNVYFRNAHRICDDMPGNVDGWYRMREWLSPGRKRTIRRMGVEYLISTEAMVDGRRMSSSVVDGGPESSASVDAITGIHRREELPDWEDPLCVSVKKYGAIGDGVTDDSDAIQRAVDAQSDVFLPKGYYKLSSGIRLRENTRMVGVAQHLSLLLAYPPFRVAGIGAAISTVDKVKASTVIANLGVELFRDVDSDLAKKLNGAFPWHGIDWACGGRSQVFFCQVHRGRRHGYVDGKSKTSTSTDLDFRRPMVLVHGHGGGKWYNHFAHGVERDASFRHIKIEGSREPLAFYHMHAQHAEGPYQCEIVDSSNKTFYGVKSEYDTGFMRVSRSSGVSIFGFGGLTACSPGGAHFVFEDSSDFIISNLCDQMPQRAGEKVLRHRQFPVTSFLEYGPIVDVRGGVVIRVDPLDRPVIYKQGRP